MISLRTRRAGCIMVAQRWVCRLAIIGLGEFESRPREGDRLLRRRSGAERGLTALTAQDDVSHLKQPQDAHSAPSFPPPSLPRSLQPSSVSSPLGRSLAHVQSHADPRYGLSRRRAITASRTILLEAARCGANIFRLWTIPYQYATFPSNPSLLS